MKMNGVVLAAAAAALFAAGTVATVSSPAEAAGVKCVGANACKGQSACKGQGFTETSDAAACTKAGGKPA